MIVQISVETIIILVLIALNTGLILGVALARPRIRH